MSKPIERYRRLKSDLDNALSQLHDFAEVVREVSNDPFVEKPSADILEALEKTGDAKYAISQALQHLESLGQRIGVPGADRESIATVIDELVAS